MNSNKYILLQVFLFYCLIAGAQVKTNFNNPVTITSTGKFNRNYPVKIDLELPMLDINALVTKENSQQKSPDPHKPFQIAQAVPVDINLAKLATWTQDGNFAYGKYSIRAKGALTVSIHFDQFHLPAGTELYVYNENGNMITGPITEAENKPNKTWGSWVYKGEYLHIEIRTPVQSKSELMLHAGSIAYGYKDIYKPKVGGFGFSGSCEVNVMCPLGNGWGPEINSVALVLDESGTWQWSGFLVMNTCNTSLPYFLTANHVLSVGPNTAGWRFTFQAFSPACSPSQNSNGVTFNGSILRSTYEPTDFCLVELDNIPPANSNIHYAGWNRSSTPATSGTTLHHPSGDVMKISRDDNSLVRGSFGSTAMQHWRVDWSAHDNGLGTIVTPVTEGGSSGSPLFDQNHRAVGQLSGGPSYCGGSSLWDFYGSFDLSWTGGGTSTTRLSNWLDAGNSGATTTNTTNISSIQTNNAVLTVSGSDNICGSSSVYTVSGVPPGSSISWSVSDPSLATIPNPSNGTSVTVTRIGNGTIILTATSSSPCMNGSGVKVIAMGTPNIVGGYYSSGGSWVPLTVWGGDPFDIENTVCFNGNPTSTNTNMEIWNASSVTWSKVFPTTFNGVTWSQSNGNAGIVFKTTNQTIGLQVTATNGCGSSDKVYAFKTVSCAMRQLFTVSPNPANSMINISVADNRDKTQDRPEELNFSEIRIYDATGIMRKYQKFNKVKSAAINLSGLDKGIYFIEISGATHKERHQLLIQK